MEDHRLALQPDAHDDGDAAPADHRPPQDDAGDLLDDLWDKISSLFQDPETKKEMEEMQAKMNVQGQMPEMSEMITNLFGGGAPAPPKKKAVTGAPPRQRRQ